MPYKIMCWIPVEPEDPEIYKSREEAEGDIEQLRFMQPENIYRIVRVEKEKESQEK